MLFSTSSFLMSLCLTTETCQHRLVSITVGYFHRITHTIYLQRVSEEKQHPNGKALTGREIRIRYLPQPETEPEARPKHMAWQEDRAVRPLGTGLRGILKSEKYKDHQLWVYSGCQDDETSADAHVEGIYQGAFTWALIKALKASN